MIKGIGIDIIELERIVRSVMRNERFAARILTANELDRYETLTSQRRKTEYLAGRFAAKEACAKAFGTGIGRLSFQDIEILNDEHGAPGMQVKGYEQGYCFVSISRSEKYVVAQVVIEE